MSDSEFQSLLENSKELPGPMGAVALAVLEMFRRGGLESNSVLALHETMKYYFATPTTEEREAILKVVRQRLNEDQSS